MKKLKEKFLNFYYSKDYYEENSKLNSTFFNIFKESPINFKVLEIEGEIKIVSLFNCYSKYIKVSDTVNIDNLENISGYVAKIENNRSIHYLYADGILSICLCCCDYKFGSISVLIRSSNLESAEKILKCSGLKIGKIKLENPKNTYQYIIVNNNGSIVSTDLTFQNFDYKEDGYNKDLPINKINEFLKSDKEGLILFYGKPGTGKTTYIKHLIQENRDINFVLLDSVFLNNVNDSKFLGYMKSNPNSIYVLEDCEKTLLRREEGSSNVNTILNLTNGILGSTLKTKFICTFNTPLNKIDKALLRKGRLFLKYRFRDLDGKKMTVSELYNSEENDFSKEEINNRVGF